MKLRVIAIFLYGTILLIAMTVLLFGYWTYQPSRVIKTNGPLTVEPPIVAAGGFATLTLSYCKLQNIEGQTRTSFVSSSAEIFQPMAAESGKKMCINNVKFPVIIPKELVPDTYYIKFRTIYKINPIKTVVEETHTEKFQVK